MDEQRFTNACQLVEDGKLTEAYDEFLQIAETTPEILDKARVLLYAAHTLQALGEEEPATRKLDSARALIEEYKCSGSVQDEKLRASELFLEFEDANLLWIRGGNRETALNRFEAILKKHASALKDPGNPYLYRGIQTRRAFILADVGRWKEALPILEGIESPQEYKEGVAFYLGHCYSSAQDFDKAEQKLHEALSLGLPRQLEHKAHCELGVAYYNLGDFAKAREEFERGAQTADASYIKESQVWRWLELTCRALGLRAEAEQYARMANPS
jgi:tetratricopeptide (TPR) repeat protein